MDDERHVIINVPHVLRQLNTNDAKHLIISFFERNHRWIANLVDRNRRTAAATNDHIEREMSGALFYLDQFAVIENKRDLMYELGGYILDLGVYKGGSTGRLARIFPDETIHGFDSFEGLPEDWTYVLKGAFGDTEGRLPDVPGNVALHKGWFEDTLPRWKASHCDRPISILRIDCDIYSSTKTIFDVLGDRLESGSWIVFDELIGYRGWEKHEYKAFKEFIDKSGFDYSYVAYGLTYAIVRLGGSASTTRELPSEVFAKGRGEFLEATSAIARLHEKFAAIPGAAPQFPEVEALPPDSVAVAVVVPVFNGAEYLTDCLESVLRQTFDAWRCYVVDDASTDETSEVMESFAARDDRFVMLRHGCNAGVSATRNTGLAHAKEPLVTFLDAEDMLTPSSLQRRVALMLLCWQDRTMAGAWGDIHAIKKNSSCADAAAFEDNSCRKPRIDFGTCNGECPFNVHAPLLRTELLRQLGGFDERLLFGGEEWDLWHRLLRHGYVFEHAGGTVGLYRRCRRRMTILGDIKYLEGAFQLLMMSNSAVLVDERLSVDPHAASSPTRLRFAAEWLRHIARQSGINIVVSGDAVNYKEMIGRVSGVPQAMTLDLKEHVVSGIKEGIGIGCRDCLPFAMSGQIDDIAEAVAEDIRNAMRVSPKDERKIATVDCRPLQAEPDVVVVAETAADVRGLVGFVSRLRARGWDAVAVDADYVRGRPRCYPGVASRRCALDFL